MTMNKASDAVCEQLKSHRVMTAWGAQIVLTEDLEKILNEESIKQIIGGYELKSMPTAAVVELIAKKSKWKKTFALLLDIDAGNLIESFISKRFCDPAKSIEDRHLHDLIPDMNKRTQFMNGQYTFFTPVFKSRFHYDLESSCHLPFLENEAVKDQGANSRIFEVTIPRSCLAPHAEIPDLLNLKNEFGGSFSNARNHTKKDFFATILSARKWTTVILQTKRFEFTKI